MLKTFNAENIFEIETNEGFVGFQGILKLSSETYKITFNDNTSVVCSSNHNFIINDFEVKAEHLKVGDNLGNKTITNIESSGIQDVYSPYKVENGVYLSNDLLHKNCSFIGSTATLVNSETLNRMISKEPISVEMEYSYRIYEEPIPGVLYVIGVDSSTGVGKDYCVIQVLKITSKDEYEQVAVYANNQIKYEQFAVVIDTISREYNNALMIIESNDVGTQVLEELWFTIGNNNILSTDKKNLGTRATVASKLKACMLLRKDLEDRKLKLNDKETIYQLTRFEEVSPNVFRGQKKSNDDLVSALYWAVFCLHQPQIDLENPVAFDSSNDYSNFPGVVLFDDNEDHTEFWSSFN